MLRNKPPLFHPPIRGTASYYLCTFNQCQLKSAQKSAVTRCVGLPHFSHSLPYPLSLRKIDPKTTYIEPGSVSPPISALLAAFRPPFRSLPAAAAAGRPPSYRFTSTPAFSLSHVFGVTPACFNRYFCTRSVGVFGRLSMYSIKRGTAKYGILSAA